MVNNYPEYAAGVNFKKTDSNNVTHFYSAQVVADPSDETIESKLIKDGVVISEGGGGTSDFSTAEVTFVDEVNTTLIYITEEEGFEAITNGTQSFSGKVKVPLYKGSCANLSDRPGYYSGLVLTGDAQIAGEGSVLVITGNCTIAMSNE